MNRIHYKISLKKQLQSLTRFELLLANNCYISLTTLIKNKKVIFAIYLIW